MEGNDEARWIPKGVEGTVESASMLNRIYPVWTVLGYRGPDSELMLRRRNRTTVFLKKGAFKDRGSGNATEENLPQISQTAPHLDLCFFYDGQKDASD